MEFIKFNKIPRLSRDMIITEKLDGGNGIVYIVKKEDIITDLTGIYAGYEFYKLFENNECYLFAGSRNRWLSVDNGKNCDSHGFAQWVKDNAKELIKLGQGRHYGEFYGFKINRNYGLDEKRFALFNVRKWCNWGEEPKLISINQKTKEEKYQEKAPRCCEIVPILYEGLFDTAMIQIQLDLLENCGSKAVPGYMNPEGIVVFHKSSGQLFKKTVKNDEKPKGIT